MAKMVRQITTQPSDSKENISPLPIKYQMALKISTILLLDILALNIQEPFQNRSRKMI